MKIKGFWKGYVELCKHSMEWLKDYWLLYTIIMVLTALIYLIPSFIEDYKWKKACKKAEDGDWDDFLSM